MLAVVVCFFFSLMMNKHFPNCAHVDNNFCYNWARNCASMVIFMIN